MDPKPRWQALQARLTAARAFMAAGDRARALEEIDAALEIDPEFLAGHSLRDRLVSGDLILPARSSNAQSGAAPGIPAALESLESLESLELMTAAGPSVAPRPQPPASPTGYARFEERAKRRRVDRQLEAARTAIEGRGLKEAAAALDEVIELDPNVPELSALTRAFDDLRRSSADHPHRGPWLAAAAVFAAMVLGASWVEDQGGLWSRPIMVLTALVQPAAPAPLVTETAGNQLAPSGTPVSAVSAARAAHAFETAADPGSTAPSGSPAPLAPMMKAPPLAEAVQPASASRSAETAAGLPLSAVFPAPTPPASLPPQANVTASARPLNATGPSSSESTAMVAKPRVDDELLVKQALQRYRVAYDGLDAQSAQAVWPAVNEAALARAFDGLSSQSLTFDRCDVQLHTETATATCHGTARYVTKMGSREPRTEPRVWNFTLRKGGTDWQIDSARVGR